MRLFNKFDYKFDKNHKSSLILKRYMFSRVSATGAKTQHIAAKACSYNSTPPRKLAYFIYDKNSLTRAKWQKLSDENQLTDAEKQCYQQVMLFNDSVGNHLAVGRDIDRSTGKILMEGNVSSVDTLPKHMGYKKGVDITSPSANRPSFFHAGRPRNVLASFYVKRKQISHDGDPIDVRIQKEINKANFNEN